MIAELMQYCRPPLSGIAVPYVDAKITQVSHDMVWVVPMVLLIISLRGQVGQTYILA